MGKKCIIEMKEGERLYKTKLNALNEPVIREIVCEPYTEPDLEQVRKEAFEKGYNTAVAEQEHAVRGAAEKSYQKGLSDAWDAARTLWNTPNRKEIFGHTTFNTVLTTLTAQETIEKIRQYEQEKEEFHVGDEFEIETGQKFVIIKMDGNKIDRYIDENGTTYCLYYKYKTMRKTGRHFPEIAEVLQKMRDEQDGSAERSKI